MSYSAGTVQVTNGSKNVVGTGTSWFGNLQEGWQFVGPDGSVYGIETVQSASALTLLTSYKGATASAQEYHAFPTRALNYILEAAVRELISEREASQDTYGSGKLPDGTLAAPSLSFVAEAASGLRRVSAGLWSLVAGGVDVLKVQSDGVTAIVKATSGPGVQFDTMDAGGGKLLKVGAGGLMNVTSLASTDNLDSWSISCDVRYHGTTVGAPSSAGVVTHKIRLAGQGAGHASQFAVSHTGQLFRRDMAAVGWGDWARLIEFSSAGNAAINGFDFGFNSFTVANGAVANIAPPRQGGFALITADGDTDYPSMYHSGLVVYDVGASLLMDKASFDGGTKTGLNLKIGTAALDGSTTPTGNTSIAARPGILQIENLSGASKKYQVAFL